MMREVEEFRNDLNAFELEDLCLELSKDLHLPIVDQLDSQAVLYAMSGVETSHCTMNIPRIEESYMPGHRYFNTQMQELAKIYGGLMSQSYGPWQIMAIKAFELGYKGHPLSLWDGRVSGPYIVKLINSIVSSGAKSMDQVLDAYNTGSFRVGEPPKHYLSRFWNFYWKYLEKKTNQKGK